jgi:MFS family permease
MTPRRIIGTYLALTAVTTLAQSLIWGVNTLFLLARGLTIFEVFAVNAVFTAGHMLFAVPTGVIGDTIGRRFCYLASTAIVLISTLAYVWVGYVRGGAVAFGLASLGLGLGFTFFIGAVDAWMVDALKALGYQGRIDDVFARSAMVFGASLVIGTLAGGFLGQLDLSLPYLVRAALLVPAFIVGLVAMPEIGFTPRPLTAKTVTGELVKMGKAGVSYGLKNPVVRPLMLVTMVESVLFLYAFYASQKFYLDLLHRPDLIWVAGAITALFGLAGIGGAALVRPLAARVPRRSSILIASLVTGIVALAAAALLRDFWVSLAAFTVWAGISGLARPVKSAWLNGCIPSSERATILSLDSLYGDAGGVVGQVGLGYVSQAASIGVAWIVGSVAQLPAVALLAEARRRSTTGDEVSSMCADDGSA